VRIGSGPAAVILYASSWGEPFRTSGHCPARAGWEGCGKGEESQKTCLRA